MITWVDDFFPNPQRICDLVNSLEFRKLENSNYPGVRTGSLEECAPEIYDELVRLLLEKTELTSVDNLELYAAFQKIPSSKNPLLNRGWIHRDPGLFSCVIYLNHAPDPNSGTVIARPKSGTAPDANAKLEFRNAYYSGKNSITEKEFIAATTVHNNRFEIDSVIENRFNRLAFFSSNLLHGQGGFETLDGEDRLTLVCFIKEKTNAIN